MDTLVNAVEEWLPSLGIAVTRVDPADIPPESCDGVEDVTSVLRPYQLDCVRLLLANVEAHGKAYLSLPTGGGKSLIMSVVLKILSAKYNLPIVIVSPRQVVNSQNLAYFKELEPGKVVAHCFQNDKTADISAESIVWWDEAHWGWDAPRADFNTKFVLYSSATPRSDVGVPVVNPYSYSYLISNGFLADIRFYWCKIEGPRDGPTAFKSSAIVKLLEHIKEEEKSTRVHCVSFHNTCKSAKHSYDSHVMNGVSAHLAVSSKTHYKTELTGSAHPAQVHINNFKEHGGIIYTVQMISMGFDFQSIDCVIFQDPKMSHQDAIQCIGRGMRADPNNSNKVLKVVVVVNENDSKTVKFAQGVYAMIRSKININVPLVEFDSDGNTHKHTSKDIQEHAKFELEEAFQSLSLGTFVKTL